MVDVQLDDELIAKAIESGKRTVTLSSGKAATIRKGKGLDLMRAQRAVMGLNDPSAVMFALVAELCEIDGQKLVYEQVLEMDLADVLELQMEIGSRNFPVPPPPASPASSSSDSPSAN